jgi:hypothetical protein
VPCEAGLLIHSDGQQQIIRQIATCESSSTTKEGECGRAADGEIRLQTHEASRNPRAICSIHWQCVRFKFWRSRDGKTVTRGNRAVHVRDLDSDDQIGRYGRLTGLSGRGARGPRRARVSLDNRAIPAQHRA